MVQKPDLTYEYYDLSDRVVSSGEAERHVTKSTTRRKFLSGTATVAGASLLSETSTAATPAPQHNIQSEEGFDGQLDSEIFTIHYYDEYESDAELIAELLSYARATVKEFYPHEYTHNVNIYLYRADEWRRSSFRTGQWFSGGEVQRARMRMVTPSEHSSGELYYRKNMVHEYTHLPLAVDLRSGSGSLKAPGWFTEGLPQYISVFKTTEAIKEEYYNGRRWKRVRQQIQDGNGFILDIGSNVYQGGPHLVQYMVDEFGRESVIDVPRSDVSTFGKALEEQLGVNPIEFELGWLQWANNEHDASYEVDTYTADETVAQTEYNDLKETNTELENRVDELEEENAALEAQVEKLQQRLDETATPVTESPTSSPESTSPTSTTGSTESATEPTTRTEAPGFGTETGIIGGLGYVMYKLRAITDSNDE